MKRTGRRTALWVAAGVGLVMILLIGLLQTRKPAVDTIAASPLVGRRAPGITGTTLAGERLDLSRLRGKFVLVNFFNSWCVPCRQEHPELLKFDERHRAAGDAQLVGVIHDDDADAVRAYLSKKGGSWPVIDDGGHIALDYGVRGQPETFVINPEGIVIKRFISAVDADGLDALLRQAQR